MSDEPLGRRLRAERERRRITLESIAANTKISPGLLRALERDDVARWPTGIFRRSFVRAYASAIGLDPDDILQEFLALHPEPIDMAEPPAPAAPRRGLPPVHLRLKLDAGPQPFSAGDLLKGARSRLSAVMWDVGFNLTVALTAYILLGRFWAPLGLSLLGYYVGSVLIIGNTPGVSFFAQSRGPAPPPADSNSDLLADLHAGTFEQRLTS
jgi:transcriptional regulator with XRE-family HTH domain